MQKTCCVFCVLTTKGCIWSERNKDFEILRIFIMQIYLLFNSMLYLLCCVPCNNHSLNTLQLSYTIAGSHFSSTKSQHVCRCFSAPSNRCDKDSAFGSCWRSDIFYCTTSLKTKLPDMHMYNSIVKVVLEAVKCIRHCDNKHHNRQSFQWLGCSLDNINK